MSKLTFVWFIRLILVVCVAGFAGCRKHIKPSELPDNISTGEVYYTQFNIFQEKNHFRTTNYRVGSLIPINSPARLVSIDNKDIVVELLDTHQTLTIDNMQKHTNETSVQAFQKIFKVTKVRLDSFTSEEKKNILAAQVKKGMSRRAVLAAIGYPPITETPSLDGGQWTYWSNRFNRFIVRFKGDKVQDIVD